MKQSNFTILSNCLIAPSTYKICLQGDTSAITRPGQFVNIRLDGFYLRRPLSVCDWNEKELTLIYKTVGKGTSYLSALQAGLTLNLLTGLGNGYDVARCDVRPLLIGGGAGIPPMYALAKTLLSRGSRPSVILGFNTVSECFCENDFRALGIDVCVTTADGSYGMKGFVTAAIPEFASATDLCVCGPEPMLRAVYDASSLPGQFSFEERMGCGFGACMGCSCETLYGARRICKDGPILFREEIKWPTHV